MGAARHQLGLLAIIVSRSPLHLTDNPATSDRGRGRRSRDAAVRRSRPPTSPCRMSSSRHRHPVCALSRRRCTAALPESRRGALYPWSTGGSPPRSMAKPLRQRRPRGVDTVWVYPCCSPAARPRPGQPYRLTLVVGVSPLPCLPICRSSTRQRGRAGGLSDGAADPSMSGP